MTGACAPQGKPPRATPDSSTEVIASEATEIPASAGAQTSGKTGAKSVEAASERKNGSPQTTSQAQRAPASSTAQQAPKSQQANKESEKVKSKSCFCFG